MKWLLLFLIWNFNTGTRTFTQSILVDHNSIEDFIKIPQYYKEKAGAMTMLFMDRSVGGNISSYLDCLSKSWSVAPSYCKKFQHRDSFYNVDPKEVYWEGIWDRNNWRYEYWPNACSEDVQCFLDFMAPRMDSFEVMGCQFSYLAVTPGSHLADPGTGFFGSKISRNHASVLANFSIQNPDKKIIWWTTSLARGIGTPESEAFNQQMRDFTLKNQFILFDVADILSHDPQGKPCFDNRDGIDYFDEKNPDDSLNIPAICPQYTTETEGGHLGSISAGGIRVAKAFWVLMARIAGWNGSTTKVTGVDLPEIELFPSPVSRELKISLPQDAMDKTYDIYCIDIHGRKRIQVHENVKNHISLECNALEPGTYYLRLNNGNQVYTKPFIVVR